MRYLILENDKHINDAIVAFINSSYFKDGDVIEDITQMSFRDLSSEDYDKFKDCDTYIFSSTLSNHEQFGNVLNLINSQDRPKTLYIHYPTDRLYIGLRDIGNKNLDGIQHFRKNGHSIHEITYERKRGTNENKFFKDIRYFFDLIPYYWNLEYGMFVPERPICIYQDSNIKSLFKYEPTWRPI